MGLTRYTKADMNKPETLVEAMTGTHTVFALTNCTSPRLTHYPPLTLRSPWVQEVKLQERREIGGD